jgi:hypothetical protein
MAVHLGQHAIRSAQVARPGRRKAGTVGQGLDHHRLADLPGLDAAGSRHKFGIETAHEAELQENPVLAGSSDDIVAFL